MKMYQIRSLNRLYHINLMYIKERNEVIYIKNNNNCR